jgi:hypothetical protein
VKVHKNFLFLSSVTDNNNADIEELVLMLSSQSSPSETAREISIFKVGFHAHKTRRVLEGPICEEIRVVV